MNLRFAAMGALLLAGAAHAHIKPIAISALLGASDKPSPSPLEAIGLQTLDIPEVKARVAGKSEAEVLGTMLQLSASGLPKLEAGLLVKRVKLLRRIMNAVDVPTCARIATGAITEAEFHSMMASLSAEQQAEWVALMKASVLAEVSGKPAPEPLSESAKADAIALLIKQVAKKDRQRFGTNLKSMATLNDVDICWTTRTMYEALSRAPDAEQLIAARALVTRTPVEILSLLIIGIPEVKARIVGKSEPEMRAIIQQLTASGLVKIDSGLLIRRAQLLEKMMKAADVPRCARIAKGTMTDEDFALLFASLSPEQQVEWSTVVKAAVVAEVSGKPAPELPTQADVTDAIAVLINQVASPERQRFATKLASLPSLGETDACWTARTLYDGISRIPDAAQSVVARAVLMSSPRASSSPLEDFGLQIIEIPAVKARVQGKSGAEVRAIIQQLTAAGLTKLESSQLVTRVKLLSEMMRAADVSLCARIATGAMSGTDFASMIASLSPQHQVEFLKVMRDAVEAEVSGKLVPELPGESAIANAMTIVMEQIPKPDHQRFAVNLNTLATLNENDACWTMKTLYEAVGKAPKPAASIAARALVMQ